MLDIYECIGWLALSLNIWGNIAIAKKSIIGWLIRLACNLAWIIYSFYFEVYPLLINHILFAGINIYGWFEWSKNTYICSCGREYGKTHEGMTCLCELPIKFNNKETK